MGREQPEQARTNIILNELLLNKPAKDSKSYFPWFNTKQAELKQKEH
jgi:hypothetical protein